MSLTHEFILLLILLVLMSVLLWVFYRTPLGVTVREKIADRARRRLFFASVSFFLTFATVRGMVYCITHNIPPFHYVIVEGRHIHHLVFGIVILLLVGYGWLCEVGNGSDSSSILASRAMSLFYGMGAALTLDEFALWLNLKDVYFVREGRRPALTPSSCLAHCSQSAPGVPRFSQGDPTASLMTDTSGGSSTKQPPREAMISRC